MTWNDKAEIFNDTDKVQLHNKVNYYGGKSKLEVYDWLSDIPLSDLSQPFPIIEVSFNQGSRKSFFRNSTSFNFKKGDFVTVEGGGGYDVGEVSLTGELVKRQMKKKQMTEDDPEIKRVLRPASESDLEQMALSKARESKILIRSRVISKEQKLDMKLTQIEVQADGKKITFYYTADHRVDFRELIKVFASEFKSKIEMRQIGIRQESAKLGGIGSCGREICCSAWLSDPRLLNSGNSSIQNLPVNASKIAGQCGRLKYCLNFELDMYLDAMKHFPNNADRLEVQSGTLKLQKKDIFRNLMWYSFAESAKQYPLTIERVNEILALNAKGEKPEELEEAEINVRLSRGGSETRADMGFVNDVGQVSLDSLSPARNKKKKKNSKNRPQKIVIASAQNHKKGNDADRHNKTQPQQNKGNKPAGENKQQTTVNKQAKNKRNHNGKPKRANTQDEV